MDDDRRRRVAIACQGGGSHTAFTAGALTVLLGAPELDEYEIVAISGTSGGAICALLAWTALLEKEPERAGALLEGFWADNSASTPMEALLNAAAVWASTMQNLGLLPSVSPYDLPVDGLGQFRELLERWVDFDRLREAQPEPSPLLLIGAVDVLSGRFRAFNSWQEPITADAVLASAAIPTLFPAVRIGEGAMGRPVLAEPSRARAARGPTGRALGHSDQPHAGRPDPAERAGYRRPPQRTRGQPLALPGACATRRLVYIPNSVGRNSKGGSWV